VEGRTSWESHKTHTLINTKRKQANRSIFGGATRQTSYRALHPVTRVITDDATQMLGIIDKHYRDLGKPPSGEKHGTYTPKEAPGTTHGKTTGRRPLNWRHEPVSSRQRPWLHNTIMDKPTTRMAALSNGRARDRTTFPMKSLRCYHQSCTSAST
jgi:hypothetical protein